jgi:hypothetical protein
MTEPGTWQTHNLVTALLPDSYYTTLWPVAEYDHASFNSVHDLPSAMAAPLLFQNAGYVNCPVVTVQQTACSLWRETAKSDFCQFAAQDISNQ